MANKTILYRGSLKSCNYQCSYCPFSKRRPTKKELETDQKQWLTFIRFFLKYAPVQPIRSLMVAPYGEALLYPWYWEGLARASACASIDAVGAQTNLSFPIQKSLSLFQRCGGQLHKLRLWATFHPEMTAVEEFSDRCKQIVGAGITLCAGAVGVPGQIACLQFLRKKLPEHIYLWVNKMDGLKRPYTKEEQDAFLQIDPYFLRELAPIPADDSKCEGRLFVEGNGKLRACNISPAFWPTQSQKPRCNRKICSCYLAYGGRDDFMNQILFGPYPLFRIPRRPKAVFFDIEGTLLQKQNGKASIPQDILAGLTALSLERIPLFFSTTLPYQEAKKRCRQIWTLFSGGVFAGGAHILFPKEGRESFHYLDTLDLTELLQLKQVLRFRMLTYKNCGRIYKITLCRPIRLPWEEGELQAVRDAFSNRNAEGIRVFAEGSCLQIVAKKADKAEGVRMLCKWMDILPNEAAAAGNAPEDAKMLHICTNDGGAKL